MHSRGWQMTIFAVLTLVPFLGPAVAEDYPPDESIMKGQHPTVPTEFVEGRATIDQVEAWSRSLIGNDAPLEYRDLDCDGRDDGLATVALVYLDEIDARIGEIADLYPQLAAWGVVKENLRSGSGKTRTRNRLDYAHSLESPRASSVEERFGEYGLQIGVTVLSKQQMAWIAGPGVGSFLHGRSMGDACVNARVISTNPRDPELEARLQRIVRASVSERSCLFE